MIATEADVTTVSGFDHMHTPFQDTVVSDMDRFQAIDPHLDRARKSWLVAWSSFVYPPRPTASDWIESGFIYSPEDETRIADRFDVFLSGLNPGRIDDADQVLNWDFTIEPEPSRPERTIQVTLQFVGRDKPLPEEDPWAT